MVEVEPEFAEEDEVRPDSSCWWRWSLFWRRRRAIKSSATRRRSAIATVSVPINVNTELVVMFICAGANKLWMKSKMAELCAPKSDDIVDEIAGAALVITMCSASFGNKRTPSIT